MQRDLQEQMIELSCRNSTTQQSFLNSSRDPTIRFKDEFDKNQEQIQQMKKVKLNEKLNLNLRLNS